MKWATDKSIILELDYIDSSQNVLFWLTNFIFFCWYVNFQFNKLEVENGKIAEMLHWALVLQYSHISFFLF